MRTEIRDDLRLAPLAKQLGWKVVVHAVDSQHGRTGTEGTCPVFPLSFRKGDKCLWLCREGWRSADLQLNCYENHQWENDLESALKKY